jgi:hypothetical protein
MDRMWVGFRRLSLKWLQPLTPTGPHPLPPNPLPQGAGEPFVPGSWHYSKPIAAKAPSP